MNIVEELKSEIKAKQKRIKSIQDSCSHPKECITKKHSGSTGNYDKQDSYWTNFHCSLCDKSWRMEGSL